MKRMLSKALCVLLVVLCMTALLIPASAAGTPTLRLSSSTQTLYTNEQTSLLFHYTQANSQEAFYFSVYDPSGEGVAELYWEMEGSAELTIGWDTTGYEPGQYTISVIALYHDGTDWQVIEKDYTYYVNLIVKTGWQKVGDYWMYGTSSTSYAKSTWQRVGGTWYYFDADGHMVTGWQYIDGKQYYFSAGGAMASGWQAIDGKWYYFANDMKTGWAKADGKWYYFGSDGVMKTGWQKIDNKWYYLNSEMKTGWQKVGSGWYYLNNEMKTGWQKIGGSWYYLASNGKMAADQWVSSGSKWYFVDSSGKMLSSQWLQRSGKWYYLDASGAMVTGTHTINGTSYTFNSNGVWVS